MDIRKIQKTGGSTFVVSLPKKWISSMGLKKNDSVMIQLQPDSSLVIRPQGDSNGAPRERLQKTLLINEDSTRHLPRELIGCYVMGYEIIKLEAQKFVSQDIRNIVREFTSLVMGFEIVDETVTEITLKDIMNPNELPFKTSIKRMFNIVKSMHGNMLVSLDQVNREMAKNVVSMDFEVNKLYWFVFRQLNNILRSPVLMTRDHERTVTHKSALNYLFIARILERVGDHTGNICKAILDLPDDEVSEEIVQETKRLATEGFNILEKTMATLFSKDIMFLNSVFDSVEALKPQLKQLRQKVQEKDLAHALQFGLILDSIRRKGEYTKDIAEHMINHIVDSDSYPPQAGKKKK